MYPFFALVIFYALLALAVVVLRGDLTGWSRDADRALSLLFVLAAIALLLGAWRPSFAPGKRVPGAPPRPRWPWWLALAGVAAAVYMAVLPPASIWIARPWVKSTANAQEASPETAQPPTDAPSQTSDGRGLGVGDPASGEPPPSPESDSLSLGRETPPEGSSSPATPREADAGTPPSSWWERLLSWLRVHSDWWRWPLAALLIAGCAWLLFRLWSGARKPHASSATDLIPWFEDPAAPGYVREFLKLCHARECAPEPGDTFLRLLRRLQTRGEEAAALHPLTTYHYLVRYEGSAAEPATEQSFVKLLRVLRKAAPAPLATSGESPRSTADRETRRSADEDDDY